MSILSPMSPKAASAPAVLDWRQHPKLREILAKIEQLGNNNAKLEAAHQKAKQAHAAAEAHLDEVQQFYLLGSVNKAELTAARQAVTDAAHALEQAQDALAENRHSIALLRRSYDEVANVAKLAAYESVRTAYMVALQGLVDAFGALEAANRCVRDAYNVASTQFPGPLSGDDIFSTAAGCSNLSWEELFSEASARSRDPRIQVFTLPEYSQTELTRWLKEAKATLARLQKEAKSEPARIQEALDAERAKRQKGN